MQGKANNGGPYCTWDGTANLTHKFHDSSLFRIHVQNRGWAAR
jgi:hypothetical protein